MTAEDILTELYENFQDGKHWDEALKKIEEYSNQRVIDELERLDNSIQNFHEGISGYELKERIKELK